MTTTLDYALMAGPAYQTTRSLVNFFPVPTGWTLFFSVPDQSTAVNFPVSAGFEAVAFQSGNQIVLSYSGTDPAASWTSGDWQTNFALLNGN